ncbi:unnamed protein product [Ambrosiozyma monospora]|uniref:Unnamed protein product n=1 Tax=Ambrosiozyma monospora TaxID=43982 RepID=A0ACB5UBU8_AMBMO|nr:unnamed protein product [Ambrosiozyma monospora]
MGFSIELIQHQQFNLNFWDIGGQTSLRSFWFNYFDKTDFLVWVIDASCLFRLQESFQEFGKVLKEDRLTGCGLLVFVNKIELFKGNQKELVEQIVDLLGLNEVRNHAWNVVCCSAYTGAGLEEGLDWITEEYSKKYYIL